MKDILICIKIIERKAKHRFIIKIPSTFIKSENLNENKKSKSLIVYGKNKIVLSGMKIKAI